MALATFLILSLSKDAQSSSNRHSSELHINELALAPAADHQQSGEQAVAHAPAQRRWRALQARPDRPALVERFDEHQCREQAKRQLQLGAPIVVEPERPQ